MICHCLGCLGLQSGCKATGTIQCGRNQSLCWNQMLLLFRNLSQCIYVSTDGFATQLHECMMNPLLSSLPALSFQLLSVQTLLRVPSLCQLACPNWRGLPWIPAAPPPPHRKSRLLARLQPIRCPKSCLGAVTAGWPTGRQTQRPGECAVTTRAEMIWWKLYICSHNGFQTSQRLLYIVIFKPLKDSLHKTIVQANVKFHKTHSKMSVTSVSCQGVESDCVELSTFGQKKF